MTRAHPDLIEAWMHYMRHSDTSKIYQRWAFISIIAGVLERKVWLIKDKDTGWYPNLFLFLIGPAGSGKSSVAETAIGMMQEVDGVDFLSDDLNESSLFHDMNHIGKSKRFEWNGESFPHAAATIFASEASETFKEQYKNGGVITKLTSLFNGGPLGWSMKHGVGRSTRGDGKVTLLNPCINMLACSTPEWLLTKCMTKNDAQGGFGSRILLVVSKDELGVENDWETESKAKDMQLRSSIIADLRLVHKMQGSYLTSLCFKEAWKECQLKYAAWRDQRAKSGILGGYQQRKMTQLYKVTMCLAAARRSELVLKGVDLLDAWKMLEEIEPAMIAVLDDLEMSPDAKARREVMEYIRRTGRQQISKAEIIRDMHKFDMQQLNVALQGLQAVGRLSVIEQNLHRTIYQIVNY